MKPLHAIAPVLTNCYLVKGWLSQGGASVVYGESNVGKTFFALDLAMHVASATDWHGNRVPAIDDRGGPVVYVAGEGGFGIHNRIEAMRRQLPDLVSRAEPEGDFLLLPVALDLCGSGDAVALVEAIRDCAEHASLIVIDTLARAMGSGDENTAKDMGMFVRNIDELRRQLTAHVMVIHHTGKDSSRGARGSSSLRAAVDTEIELTRVGEVIMAEARKQRDMPTGQVFAYTLRDVEIGQDQDGDPVTSAVVEAAEPVRKRPTLSPQQRIAMQALQDALANHGDKKAGNLFPQNRQCVSLDHWREYCDRHSLSDGADSSAARQAFRRARKSLHEKEMIRIVDGFVWICGDEKA